MKHFCNFLFLNAYIYIITKLRRNFELDNMDINKLLAAISKMDKEELEKNIYKAQAILENSNFKNNFNKGDK